MSHGFTLNHIKFKCVKMKLTVNTVFVFFLSAAYKLLKHFVWASFVTKVFKIVQIEFCFENATIFVVLC